MEISINQEKSRVPISVLHVNGDIDSSNYQVLEERARAAIEEGCQYLLVDFGGVHYISSAALRTLNQIFHQLRTRSKDCSDEEMYQGINAGTYKSPYLKLLNPSKAVLEVIKITGFDMFLEIHTDIKTALASF
jgi:anti-anti-sigma factor